MSFLSQLFKNCLVAAKDEEEEEEELISIDPGWLDRLVELQASKDDRVELPASIVVRLVNSAMDVEIYRLGKEYDASFEAAHR